MARTKTPAAGPSNRRNNRGRRTNRQAQNPTPPLVVEDAPFFNPDCETIYNRIIGNPKLLSPGWNVIFEDFRGFDWVLDRFRHQGWEPILSLVEPIYPQLICQFYANASFNITYSRLTTKLNGVRYEISPALFNEALQVPNCGVCFRSNYNAWPEVDFNLRRFCELFLGGRTIANTKEAVTTDFSPPHRVLYSLIKNCILTSKGHRTQLTYSGIFVAYNLVLDHQIDLGDLIWYEMKQAKERGLRNLPYGRILTVLFRHLHIPLDDFPSSPSTEVFKRSNLAKMGVLANIAPQEDSDEETDNNEEDVQVEEIAPEHEDIPPQGDEHRSKYTHDDSALRHIGTSLSRLHQYHAELRTSVNESVSSINTRLDGFGLQLTDMQEQLRAFMMSQASSSRPPRDASDDDDGDDAT